MSDVPEQETPKKRKQGFAALSPERRREIARKGGKRAHELGLAYKWDHESAVAAGKKGGMKTSEYYARKIRERLGEA